MTSNTPTKLNKYQREMLEGAMNVVESLKTQRQALALEITERMDSLAETFGTDAVEYETDEGRTIKFRLVTSKRTAYKAVVEEVKAASSKPMVQFIDRTIEANTTEATRKVLTAGKAKKGHANHNGAKAALTSAQVLAIRADRKKGASFGSLAKRYGVSHPTVKNAAERKGAYATV